ncbi:MAG: formylglycine-generating enzyme family protein, partial [Deltaproteobacteria bacterium]|nr:formylglycine-generating enzyme family protein [Deltaproteobacteria bacterium]
IEILKKPGRNRGLWERQLAALRILDRLEPIVIDEMISTLTQHPYSGIRNWAEERIGIPEIEITPPEKIDYELIRIPGGVFQMGSPKSEKGRDDDEGPVHKVEVPGFDMGKYPVTNEQYARFLEKNSDASEPRFWADRKYNQPRQPVVGVSWGDAKQFAKWAGLRLPSEAEWEYACRAGTKTRYHSGNTDKDLGKAGWYSGNSGGKLHAVGQKEPNDFGLHDMHGNVWEWVEDDWHDDYKGAPGDGSPWVDEPRGSYRVFRGGSCYGDALNCRSAHRSSYAPSVSASPGPLPLALEPLDTRRKSREQGAGSGEWGEDSMEQGAGARSRGREQGQGVGAGSGVKEAKMPEAEWRERKAPPGRSRRRKSDRNAAEGKMIKDKIIKKNDQGQNN